MDVELSYLQQRVLAEKSAAASARHPAVRHAHEELAWRYESRINGLYKDREALRMDLLETV
jgi:hypothetical protein